MAHGLRTLRKALLLRGLGLLGTRRRRIVGWRALAGETSVRWRDAWNAIAAPLFMAGVERGHRA